MEPCPIAPSASSHEQSLCILCTRPCSVCRDFNKCSAPGCLHCGSEDHRSHEPDCPYTEKNQTVMLTSFSKQSRTLV
jgi:hypothetical protein